MMIIKKIKGAIAKISFGVIVVIIAISIMVTPTAIIFYKAASPTKFIWLGIAIVGGILFLFSAFSGLIKLTEKER